jgi:hypothetical protein
VAVGDNLFTSPDGVNWTRRTISHPYRLYSDNLFSVTYGNNMFIAVGDKGKSYTSLNGVFTSVLSVLHLGSAHTEPDSSIIFTSVDGVDWTPRFELQGARL